MIRSEKRLRTAKILLVLNLAFIWGNYLLPGELSGAFSDWVKNLILSLLPAQSGVGVGGGLFRKLAHFTEFALLGIVLFRLIRNREDKTPVAWLLSLGCGFFVACVDELLQHFSPGRAPRFGDVCIDTAGVLTGTLLYLAAHFICKSKTIK